MGGGELNERSDSSRYERRVYEFTAELIIIFISGFLNLGEVRVLDRFNNSPDQNSALGTRLSVHFPTT